MAHPQKAGKTAPRLAEDIRLYDPAHPPGTGRNLLSEVPPIFQDRRDGPQDWISSEACQHKYLIKADQTFLAQEELKRRPGASSKVSAICSRCRCHLQVVVNHNSGGNTFARQARESHIHHLVYKSGRQHGTSSVEVTEQGQVVETFHYQCSHISCSAMVSLRILSPLLNPQFVYLLTDPDAIRQRAEEAIAAEPERLEGMAKPLPINILDNLRLYLSNSLHNNKFSKAISGNNKRFMISFGVEGKPCQQLLEFLGFTYREDQTWQPPQPDPGAETPYQDALCVFLDDVIHELLSLINYRPLSERKGVTVPHLPPSASDGILQALEASNYSKTPRAENFEMAYAPYYEDLGVVEDMDTPLIIDAYRRQVSLDSANAPHYLECLKSIGMLRGGQDWEFIDQAVQAAYAEGKYTMNDLDAAYNYFHLSREDSSITEDNIIGKYYAYLGSVSQSDQILEAARNLWRIGNSRGSDRIMAVSEDRVGTAEQAEVFLGIDANTPDDFIITMYTAKLTDNPACKDLADKALKLIAENRNSIGLKHFLDTGETVEGDMDIGDAYRLLQIPDRTADADAVIAAYTICVNENAGQAETYHRALSIIAKEMDNVGLKNLAGISTEPDRDLLEWPVGLQNIGNTCYLNSLLQFYFSVRPFRDMVLDFEKHQMDLNDEQSVSQKQVGSRKVAKKEIERSLKFLGELRNLFHEMIGSTRSSVIPGPELARLTLISPGGEAAIRRRSTIGKSSSLGEIEGAPVLGPLGPPPPIVEEQNEQTVASTVAKSVHAKDPNPAGVGSDAALLSDDIEREGLDDNEDCDVLSPKTGEPEGGVPLDSDSKAPNRPPPVPPRPVPEVDRQRQLIEEVEIGAQQDVTEVINNVLFQSQCAIKPIRVAADGEQVDQIKDLFYGQTRSYISTGKETRSKEERWCDIKVNVAGGSRDIYAAIDGAFDAQKISVEDTEAEQYGSITRLPPILQIQVQRVQFDPVKKSSFKSTHHLELLETIYMDRYMDTQKSEIVDRRRRCWEWKSALKSLEARKAELLRKQEEDGLTMSQLLSKAKEALEGLEEITAEDSSQIESLSSELDLLSESANAELQAIDQQAQGIKAMISNQFAEYRNLPYRLYAVFVHHGSVSFGHYWIYIYDIRKDVWRKYNDEYVTEVKNLDEIFKNTSTSNPPTPYFLVYINEKMKERLVDPVCRDIVQHMPDAPIAETSAEVPLAMEGIQATQPPEDVDMGLPSYDEVAGAGKDSSQSSVDPKP
ncbi:hypothetical protein N7523_002361 [Penicillium sp. IBT 18751x]|nr:hypothetical protein N7523_002361 [Penicillium sp. IBT 18751x]